MTRNWTHVQITEQGGFAGLLRGAELQASTLGDAQLARVTKCLAAVQELATLPQPPPNVHADQQIIRLECHAGANSWQASFDRSDLPGEVSTLLDSVRLKPMQPR